MARISTYQTDELISDDDRLIGTDGGQIGADGRVISGTAGRTRNFTIRDLTAYIGSRTSDVTGDYNTLLIPGTNPDIDNHLAELFTAYAVYDAGMNVQITLPTVGTDGTAIADGSWIRFAFIGNTGGMIYAGSPMASQAAPGDRFMAGIAADGSNADAPNLLMIQQNNAVSLELIYVADLITTTDGGTAPVGWIIVN